MTTVKVKLQTGRIENLITPGDRAPPEIIMKKLLNAGNSQKWNPQFHTKNPSVQHQKALSSPPIKSYCKARLFRVLWCGTEGFSVLNWEVFGVELRDFGSWKRMALLCEPDVLNWPKLTIFGINQFSKVQIRAVKKFQKIWSPRVIWGQSFDFGLKMCLRWIR